MKGIVAAAAGGGFVALAGAAAAMEPGAGVCNGYDPVLRCPAPGYTLHWELVSRRERVATCIKYEPLIVQHECTVGVYNWQSGLCELVVSRRARLSCPMGAVLVDDVAPGVDPFCEVTDRAVLRGGGNTLAPSRLPPDFVCGQGEYLNKKNRSCETVKISDPIPVCSGRFIDNGSKQGYICMGRKTMQPEWICVMPPDAEDVVVDVATTLPAPPLEPAYVARDEFVEGPVDVVADYREQGAIYSARPADGYAAGGYAVGGVNGVNGGISAVGSVVGSTVINGGRGNEVGSNNRVHSHVHGGGAVVAAEPAPTPRYSGPPLPPAGDGVHDWRTEVPKVWFPDGIRRDQPARRGGGGNSYWAFDRSFVQVTDEEGRRAGGAGSAVNFPPEDVWVSRPEVVVDGVAPPNPVVINALHPAEGAGAVDAAATVAAAASGYAGGPLPVLGEDAAGQPVFYEAIVNRGTPAVAASASGTTTEISAVRAGQAPSIRLGTGRPDTANWIGRAPTSISDLNELGLSMPSEIYEGPVIADDPDDFIQLQYNDLDLARAGVHAALANQLDVAAPASFRFAAPFTQLGRPVNDGTLSTMGGLRPLAPAPRVFSARAATPVSGPPAAASAAAAAAS